MGDEINGFHLSSKCTKIMWNLKRGSGHTTFLIKYQNRVNFVVSSEPPHVGCQSDLAILHKLSKTSLEKTVNCTNC